MKNGSRGSVPAGSRGPDYHPAAHTTGSLQQTTKISPSTSKSLPPVVASSKSSISLAPSKCSSTSFSSSKSLASSAAPSAMSQSSLSSSLLSSSSLVSSLSALSGMSLVPRPHSSSPSAASQSVSPSVAKLTSGVPSPSPSLRPKNALLYRSMSKQSVNYPSSSSNVRSITTTSKLSSVPSSVLPYYLGTLAPNATNSTQMLSQTRSTLPPSLSSSTSASSASASSFASVASSASSALSTPSFSAPLPSQIFPPVSTSSPTPPARLSLSTSIFPTPSLSRSPSPAATGTTLGIRAPVYPIVWMPSNQPHIEKFPYQHPSFPSGNQRTSIQRQNLQSSPSQRQQANHDFYPYLSNLSPKQVHAYANPSLFDSISPRSPSSSTGILPSTRFSSSSAATSATLQAPSSRKVEVTSKSASSASSTSSPSSKTSSTPSRPISASSKSPSLMPVTSQSASSPPPSPPLALSSSAAPSPLKARSTQPTIPISECVDAQTKDAAILELRHASSSSSFLSCQSDSILLENASFSTPKYSTSPSRSSTSTHHPIPFHCSIAPQNSAFATTKSPSPPSIPLQSASETPSQPSSSLPQSPMSFSKNSSLSSISNQSSDIHRNFVNQRDILNISYQRQSQQWNNFQQQNTPLFRTVAVHTKQQKNSPTIHSLQSSFSNVSKFYSTGNEYLVARSSLQPPPSSAQPLTNTQSQSASSSTSSSSPSTFNQQNGAAPTKNRGTDESFNYMTPVFSFNSCCQRAESLDQHESEKKGSTLLRPIQQLHAAETESKAMVEDACRRRSRMLKAARFEADEEVQRLRDAAEKQLQRLQEEVSLETAMINEDEDRKVDNEIRDMKEGERERIQSTVEYLTGLITTVDTKIPEGAIKTMTKREVVKKFARCKTRYHKTSTSIMLGSRDLLMVTDEGEKRVLHEGSGLRRKSELSHGSFWTRHQTMIPSSSSSRMMSLDMSRTRILGADGNFSMSQEFLAGIHRRPQTDPADDNLTDSDTPLFGIPSRRSLGRASVDLAVISSISERHPENFDAEIPRSLLNDLRTTARRNKLAEDVTWWREARQSSDVESDEGAARSGSGNHLSVSPADIPSGNRSRKTSISGSEGGPPSDCEA